MMTMAEKVAKAQKPPKAETSADTKAKADVADKTKATVDREIEKEKVRVPKVSVVKKIFARGGVKKEPKAAEEQRPQTMAEQKIREVKRDPWLILRYPKLTEKALTNVEKENKLVFIVRSGASKSQIKAAVEAAFDVKVMAVNTLIAVSGEKKAFVKLRPENSALDVATKLGML